MAALELLNHLILVNAGTPGGDLFVQLRQEITQDQAVLRDLLEQLDFKQSPMRQTVAWFSEKFARVKLMVEDRTGDQLARLETLEALALGIEGKRALWSALKVVAERAPALRSLDFRSLEQRAREQRERVEAVRLDAAHEALL